jgi:2-desacetyl-2-hydroxyethyl bacteriochlorophyllide A dehydrogenase
MTASSQETFRSAAWTGTEFRIDELPIAEPGPGDVRVRIAACGVCVTEVHYVDGLYDGFNLPPRLGHEYGGLVEAVGPGVEGIEVGDAVGAVGSFGGFGEAVVAPAKDFLRISAGLPLHHSCFLEPVSACTKALRLGRIPFGGSVLVAGAGSNGLLLLQLARLSGAARVVVSEPNGERRALARQLGADEVLDPGEASVPDQVGGRPFQVAFETSGHPAALRECLDVVAAEGRAVMFGVSSDTARLELPLWGFHMSDAALVASMGYDHEATEVAAAILPRLEIEPLITDRFSLEGVADAFEAARNGTSLKSLVYPDQMGRAEGIE